MYKLNNTQSIQNLMVNIHNGDLLLFRQKHYFVWSNQQRLLLLDSIVRGMPIGIFYFWRTKRHDFETIETIKTIESVVTPGNDEMKTYLVDGYQRFLSMHISLHDHSYNNDIYWPIYYDWSKIIDFLTFSESFTSVSLSTLMSSDKICQFCKKKNVSKIERAKMKALAETIKGYQINFSILFNENPKTIFDSMARINGT